MKMLEIIGIVNKIFFRSDTGFSLIKFKVYNEVTNGVKKRTSYTTILAVKNGENINEGDTSFVFGGEYVSNDGYNTIGTNGKKFEVKYFYRSIPDNEVELKDFLIKNINGIGEKIADLLISECGKDLIAILNDNNHIKELGTLSGIGETTIKKIKKSWDEEMEKRDIMKWLSENNISIEFLPQIIELIGEYGLHKIKENPYLLTSISEISFKEVERIVEVNNLSFDVKTRMESLIIYLLNNAEKYGSLALPLSSIIEEVDMIFDKTTENRELLYDIILNNPLLSHYRSPQELDKTKTLIYLTKIFESEKYIASFIKNKLDKNHNRLISEEDLEITLKIIEEELGFPLNKEQKDGIFNFFNYRISIIVGGGGSGKTTVLGAINQIANFFNIDLINITPTGSSSKNIIDKTGFNSSVLHSKIGINPLQDDLYNFNLKINPIEAKGVIIDELGLIDNAGFFQLMRALTNSETHLVFIGDVKQNSSPGAGNILSDLLGSQVIPTVNLVEANRFENDKINEIANVLYSGKIPEDLYVINDTIFDKSTFNKEGVILHNMGNEIETLEQSIELYKFMLNSKINPKDIQFFSPMYKGNIGVEKLNQIVQGILIDLNFLKTEKVLNYNGKKFHIGDKVHRVKRNDYKNGIINGSIGFVTDINEDNFEIEVDFGGVITTFLKSELILLDLAYCIISGKGQGLGVKYAIMPLSIGQFQALNKEMIYTFITRGIKESHLLCSKSTLNVAISKTGLLNRFTSLKNLLKN